MAGCEKILDIGCGEGAFVRLAPDRIVGLERNEVSAEICRKDGLNVVTGDALEMPLEDASFDAVHSSHLIEHFHPDQAHQFLSEVDRVLKKGGIFCLRAPMLCPTFYSNLTHIRPYHPWAILHYLCPGRARQHTMPPISESYEVVTLKFRRRIPFPEIHASPTALIRRAANIVCCLLWGWHTRTGYLLVLRKH